MFPTVYMFAYYYCYVCPRSTTPPKKPGISTELPNHSVLPVRETGLPWAILKKEWRPQGLLLCALGAYVMYSHSATAIYVLPVRETMDYFRAILLRP